MVTPAMYGETTGETDEYGLPVRYGLMQPAVSVVDPSTCGSSTDPSTRDPSILGGFANVGSPPSGAWRCASSPWELNPWSGLSDENPCVGFTNAYLVRWRWKVSQLIHGSSAVDAQSGALWDGRLPDLILQWQLRPAPRPPARSASKPPRAGNGASAP